MSKFEDKTCAHGNGIDNVIVCEQRFGINATLPRPAIPLESVAAYRCSFAILSLTIGESRRLISWAFERRDRAATLKRLSLNYLPGALRSMTTIEAVSMRNNAQ